MKTKEQRTQYMREWRKKNPEKLKEYRRNYRQKNRDRLIKAGREDYKKNREKRIIAMKDYYKRNRDRHREYYWNLFLQWLSIIKEHFGEIKCQKCGYKFERLQNMTDPPITNCPQCDGNVKRLIGKGAGIIFKGSGFHETDYRSDNYKKDAEKEKIADKESESSSSDSTEKKGEKENKDEGD